MLYFAQICIKLKLHPRKLLLFEHLYTIWDTFGVGMANDRKRYFPGFVPFWVLQHYRNHELGYEMGFVPIRDHSVQIETTAWICF